MEKQEFRYATLSKFADHEDIMFAIYEPKLEINIEIAHELVENRMQFSENKHHYILIDFTNVKSVTKEARDFMNDPKGGLRGILGGAFLSNNVVATLFVNLYLKVNRPTTPARFFTSKADAMNWLVKTKIDNAQLA
jgi:hypothetical protein